MSDCCCENKNKWHHCPKCHHKCFQKCPVCDHECDWECCKCQKCGHDFDHGHECPKCHCRF